MLKIDKNKQELQNFILCDFSLYTKWTVQDMLSLHRTHLSVFFIYIRTKNYTTKLKTFKKSVGKKFSDTINKMSAVHFFSFNEVFCWSGYDTNKFAKLMSIVYKIISYCYFYFQRQLLKHPFQSVDVFQNTGYMYV